MRKPLKNVGASVRARLLNLAKERNEPFDLLLTQYALERLLYRLSISKYKDKFVLKVLCCCGTGSMIHIGQRATSPCSGLARAIRN
ncbi:hypothetical protein [Bradyrhizobium agreste]|uniref:hypothetical protein n=1 Tax=Bradyrhizobium agreste TaxID=2751811 RepID=UPI00289F9935|nr:hypothetical protein [Bradyrhizobium agreste]